MIPFIGYGLGAVIIVMILMMMRILLKSKPYEFDLIMMSPGVNEHIRIKGDTLTFEHEHKGTEYEVKADRLYRVRVGKLMSLWFRLRGIKSRFVIVFQHEKTDPVRAEDVEVSTRVLKKVNESRALGKALRSQFSVPMDLKKILMIMGFIVIIVIAYVIVTGGIVI